MTAPADEALKLQRPLLDDYGKENFKIPGEVIEKREKLVTITPAPDAAFEPLHFTQCLCAGGHRTKRYKL